MFFTSNTFCTNSLSFIKPLRCTLRFFSLGQSFPTSSSWVPRYQLWHNLSSQLLLPKCSLDFPLCSQVQVIFFWQGFRCNCAYIMSTCHQKERILWYKKLKGAYCNHKNSDKQKRLCPQLFKTQTVFTMHELPLLGTDFFTEATWSSEIARRLRTSANAAFSTVISSSCCWTRDSRAERRSCTSEVLAAEILSSKKRKCWLF